jgi:hypothetical protein
MLIEIIETTGSTGVLGFDLKMSNCSITIGFKMIMEKNS